MAFSLSTLKALLNTDSGGSNTRSSVVGIDIGSSAIKVVQIKAIKGTPTLETYGELQLGPYEGVELGRNTHLPLPKAIEALLDIIREASVSTKNAACALSYNSSFTSILSLPTLAEEQIGTMLPVEARKYVPVALNKVTLDWIPLGSDEKAQYTRVLLTALYNDALTEYQSLMQGAGLSISAKEVEIFSSIRATVAPDDVSVAIIDLGASATRLYIIEKGTLMKTHSVLTSGVELTKSLATALEIEFSAAEELKRAAGLLGVADDPRVAKTLGDELRRGMRELHTVMQRYGETEGTKISKVILSGGGAGLRGVVPFAADLFATPTVIADPFSKIAYPAFLEKTLHESGASFAVAIGVALRIYQTTE